VLGRLREAKRPERAKSRASFCPKTPPHQPAASGAECARIIDEYFATRHHKGTLQVPRLQLRALLLGTYNKLLSEGDAEAAAKWAHRALLDEAGLPDIQSLIQSIAAKRERFKLGEMMWGPSVAHEVDA